MYVADSGYSVMRAITITTGAVTTLTGIVNVRGSTNGPRVLELGNFVRS